MAVTRTTHRPAARQSPDCRSGSSPCEGGIADLEEIQRENDEADDQHSAEEWGWHLANEVGP